MQNTIFKDIPDFEGIYEISQGGLVRKISTKRILKSYFRNRYPIINLFKLRKITTHYLHRLVLMTWDRFPKLGEETRHLDNNPLNCHIDNLRWGTSAENTADMIQTGRHSKGSKKRPCQNSLGETFMSIAQAARHYNVAHTTIGEACREKHKSCGLLWEYVD